MGQDVRLPYGTSVNKIEMLVDLIGHGTYRKTELYGDSEPFSKNNFYRTANTAKELGLVEEVGKAERNTKIRLTQSGKKFGSDSQARAEALEEGIKSHPLYSKLLNTLVPGDYDGKKITKKEVIEELRELNNDVSDRTLNGTATLFLKMLEQAEMGEYRRGRGSDSTFLFTPDNHQQVSINEKHSQTNSNPKDKHKDTEKEQETEKLPNRNYSYSRESDKVSVEIPADRLNSKDITELVSMLEEWSQRT